MNKHFSSILLMTAVSCAFIGCGKKDGKTGAEATEIETTEIEDEEKAPEERFDFVIDSNSKLSGPNKDYVSIVEGTVKVKIAEEKYSSSDITIPVELKLKKSFSKNKEVSLGSGWKMILCDEDGLPTEVDLSLNYTEKEKLKTFLQGSVGDTERFIWTGSVHSKTSYSDDERAIAKAAKSFEIQNVIVEEYVAPEPSSTDASSSSIEVADDVSSSYDDVSSYDDDDDDDISSSISSARNKVKDAYGKAKEQVKDAYGKAAEEVLGSSAAAKAVGKAYGKAVEKAMDDYNDALDDLLDDW